MVQSTTNEMEHSPSIHYKMLQSLTSVSLYQGGNIDIITILYSRTHGRQDISNYFCPKVMVEHTAFGQYLCDVR